MPVMWIIGGVLIFLAIKKEMEPTLLLPMGFGAILVNLPFSGAAAVIDHLFSRKKINPMIFIFIVTGVIILVLILNTTVEVVANKRKK